MPQPLIHTLEALCGPPDKVELGQLTSALLTYCDITQDVAAATRLKIVHEFLERWQTSIRTAEAERLRAAIQQHFQPST